MPEVIGETSKPNIAAVRGTHKGSGNSGVFGEAKTGPGVSGVSTSSVGVDAKSQSGPAALRAVHAGGGIGVLARTSGGTTGLAGVRGESVGGPGVSAHSTNSVGVDATTDKGQAAVRATGGRSNGVFGRSQAAIGVFGESQDSEGVRGLSHNKAHGGVVGVSSAAGGHSVFGTCDGVDGTGIVAVVKKGTGLFARAENGLAASFDGDVRLVGILTVKGDVVLEGADLAEQFGVVGDLAAEPGCVVVLAGEDRVRVSDKAYDHRVAGVISGAGSYKPALVLDRKLGADRRALALTGKVWCNVDANSRIRGCAQRL